LNKNGEIEFSEFVCACSKWKEINEDDAIIEVFEIFDKNGDGKITLDELKEFFENHKESTNIEENVWEQVLDEVD
jgi:calcium-dependent protein kinase